MKAIIPMSFKEWLDRCEEDLRLVSNPLCNVCDGGGFDEKEGDGICHCVKETYQRIRRDEEEKIRRYTQGRSR